MRFDHILFPTDFSERSVAMNAQVEWLASRFGSRVTLVHVFEIPMSWYGSCEASYINLECFDELRASAEKRLKEYAINVPEERVERIFMEGNPADELMNWMADHPADLIVMGTHGYGALKGWVLGSIAAKVLHRANCPVWLDSGQHSHTNPFSAITKVLCSIELTDEAVPLLRFTKELASDLGATVQLIHSEPENYVRPNRYFDFDLHRYLVDSARVAIGKMQREAETDFPLTISGSGVGSALAEATGDGEHTLIVIGRGKADKRFGRFQTHTYEIIRHAQSPVISFWLNPQDHISASYSAEHPAQSSVSEQLLTGSPKT